MIVGLFEMFKKSTIILKDLRFFFCIFQLSEKLVAKSVMFGPIPHGRRFSCKKKIFAPYPLLPKAIVPEVCCFWQPVYDCVKKLSTASLLVNSHSDFTLQICRKSVIWVNVCHT